MSTPSSIGDYEVLGLLGKGGMSEVYLVRLPGAAGFSKRAALKRMHVSEEGDDRSMRSLINEARMVSQLSHPNLIEVFGFELIEGAHCMVMEYVEGASLLDLNRYFRREGHPPPAPIIAQIAVEVCAGLHYAHTHVAEDGTPLNLVHRDIKPANILLSRHGHVKVADFGIAKSSINPFQTTGEDVVKGTLAYMSPEQILGKPIDPRSDLFSLGLVLYEALTGERLIKTRNITELLGTIHEGYRPECREMVEGVAPEWNQVLERLLAAEPEDRFQSARETLAALEQDVRLSGRLAVGETVEAVFQARLARRPSPPGVEPPRSQETSGGTAGLAALASGHVAALEDGSGGYSRANTGAGLSVPGSEQQDVDPTLQAGPPPPEILNHPPSSLNAARLTGRHIPSRGEDSAAGVGVTASAPESAPAPRPRSWTGPLVAGAAGVLITLAVVAGSTWMGSGSATAPADDPPPAVAPNQPAEPNATGGAGAPAPVPTAATAAQTDAGAAAQDGQPKAGGASDDKPTPAKREPEPAAVPPAPRVASSASSRPAPAPAAAPAVNAAPGKLTVNADPWATAYLDGVEKGIYIKESVPAGRHTVRLVGPGGAQKTFTVDIEPGEEVVRVWSFTQERFLK